MNDRDELLRYYEQELTHLRRMGSEFARKYPKVAARLELSADQCPDPFVERLIESFSFLTARIRHDLDSHFPEIPAALLGILYPHYLNPIPSMAVARFEVDPTRGKLTSGFTIPKSTHLFATTHQGHTCRFRTCYPVTLWPLDVTEAAFETRDQLDTLSLPGRFISAIRVRVSSRGGSLKELDLSSLRFHLNGEPTLVYALHRLLFADCVGVALVPEGSSRPVMLPRDAMRGVGFGEKEEMLPYPRHAQQHYRLLQEYFAFPEKFLFFDLERLDRHESERYFDILFLFDVMPERRPLLARDTFLLGCAPVINLFPKTTEPIRLNHLKSEYPLIPDKRREGSTEIYSIERVSGSSNEQEDASVLEPFFSYNHQRTGEEAYWYVRRVPTGRADISGTDMLLSIVDPSFNPALPSSQTIYAHTLCTNRMLAGELPAGGLLQMEDAAPLARIYTLAKPTRQVAPPLGGMTYWRLISQLSLNYLSASGGEQGLKSLREILRLYAFGDDPSHQMQIMGIVGMECRKAVRRIGSDAWRGFCGGTEITLIFDETKYAGGSPFLLASVLNQFFGLYTSINAFTQLRARSILQERIWKTWEPIIGARNIL